ncbi:hypothetical protein NDU88_004638 [Pleurodeles waltl]|uniref:Uncharacterized protein n=1 Tax=Pleurodeles waltl TaxID=8319 RepID=A0AAV7T9Q0_PLEWA|nr:hypothetical protein NDU88_004638 [Pleurodeles waltl]
MPGGPGRARTSAKPKGQAPRRTGGPSATKLWGPHTPITAPPRIPPPAATRPHHPKGGASLATPGRAVQQPRNTRPPEARGYKIAGAAARLDSRRPPQQHSPRAPHQRGAEDFSWVPAAARGSPSRPSVPSLTGPTPELQGRQRHRPNLKISWPGERYQCCSVWRNKRNSPKSGRASLGDAHFACRLAPPPRPLQVSILKLN